MIRRDAPNGGATYAAGIAEGLRRARALVGTDPGLDQAITDAEAYARAKAKPAPVMAPSPEPFIATCDGEGDAETCPCRACHSERCARALAEAY